MEVQLVERGSTDAQVTKLETKVQNVTKTNNNLRNLIVAMNMKMDSWPSTSTKMLILSFDTTTHFFHVYEEKIISFPSQDCDYCAVATMGHYIEISLLRW